MTRLAGVGSGVPVVADHLQQGCGCSGVQLGLTGVGGAGGQDQSVRGVIYCATFFYT